MDSEFAPVCLAGRDAYLERLGRCPVKTSDYAFGNIFGWAEVYGLQWRFGRSHVWLRQTLPEVVYWAPVGPWEGEKWADCPVLADGLTMTRTPEPLRDVFAASLGQRLEVVEAREHWDYVYDVRELVELKGNRFHKKKNLLRQFEREYRAEYKELTSDCVEETLDMQLQWCRWRDCEDASTLVAENAAIARILKNWDRLPGLFGGALRINGSMVAYTVAEALSDDMAVIHFEKGRPEYKGVYQAINQNFLAHLPEHFRLVNREQDLGDEGLRKAKLSYNPVDLLKKYTVTVRAA